MGSAGCRVAVFQAPSVICRSPTGTGTSALLTLAYAREAIEVGTVLATRSPTGGRFYGRIIAVQPGTDVERVMTAISGNVNTGREIRIE
jgi:proline racemase